MEKAHTWGRCPSNVSLTPEFLPGLKSLGQALHIKENVCCRGTHRKEGTNQWQNKLNCYLSPAEILQNEEKCYRKWVLWVLQIAYQNAQSPGNEHNVVWHKWFRSKQIMATHEGTQSVFLSSRPQMAKWGMLQILEVSVKTAHPRPLYEP